MSDSASQSKILLIFCDGTGQDGLLSRDLPPAAQGDASTAEFVHTESLHYASNVLRLSRAVYPWSSDGRRQIVYYQSGVASETDFNGEDPDQATILRQAYGTTVASKIRDAYAFIAQNYEEGDDICMFGFSRGAYTVRKVAGLIHAIGLLSRTQLGQFFLLWKLLVEGKPQALNPADTRKVRIKCVGVWDTVGSVRNIIDALSIKDTSLPPTIDVALHALSLHENREKFLPTLWSIPSKGLSAIANGSLQTIKQVWFPGAHSDVGGGYERHELADLSLFWMAGEINGFINLDLEFLRRSGQRVPERWGTSIPHNEYQALNPLIKKIIGHETRLEGALIVKDSIFHPSVEVSPTTLPDPKYMVTLPIVQKEFGLSWTPKYSTLNKFEEHCKELWGHPPAQDGTFGYPIFESPWDLFGTAL